VLRRGTEAARALRRVCMRASFRAESTTTVMRRSRLYTRRMGPNLSTLRVSAAVLAQLARYLSSLGIDATRLMLSVGADPAILESPDDQIPIETHIAIENEAARASGDPCFGLHVGEFAEPGNYSILGYVMMNSRTLGEAVMEAGRYYRIIGDLLALRVGPHARGRIGMDLRLGLPALGAAAPPSRRPRGGQGRG
jgi:hypothetical protein